ncbi:MAG: hypothetical protein AAFR77_03940 [Cyanobacteria bacterium J06631_2]
MSNISISASLAAIALTTIATIAPANAQGQSSVESNQSYLVSPRQLISLARQGRFKAQGIPSHNNFRNGVRGGKITAADLVESAIANNRLPENARSNQQYLSTLASHLKSGGCGS